MRMQREKRRAKPRIELRSHMTTGPGELETLCEELEQSREQTEALQEEVRSLQKQLGNERNRYKSLWHAI